MENVSPADCPAHTQLCQHWQQWQQWQGSCPTTHIGYSCPLQLIAQNSLGLLSLLLLQLLSHLEFLGFFQLFLLHFLFFSAYLHKSVLAVF